MIIDILPLPPIRRDPLDHHATQTQSRAIPRSIPSISRLENLPAELRLSILYALSDVTALSALVHASPIFHSAYLSQRKDILTSVLCRDINPRFIFIACMAAAGSGDGTSELHEYRKSRLLEISSVLLCLLDPTHPCPGALLSWEHGWDKRLISPVLFETARLHCTVVAVASQYSQSILSRNPVTGMGQNDGQNMSFAESLRLHRALYYYELYCKVYASRIPSERGSRLIAHPEIFELRKFLIRLRVWEVEEIACLYYHIYKFYENLFLICLKELEHLEDRLLHVRKRPYGDECEFGTGYPAQYPNLIYLSALTD